MVVMTCILSVCTVTSHAATEGSASANATVNQILDLEVVSTSGDLGDVRTGLRRQNMFDLVLSNNNVDGFKLTFTSGNGEYTSVQHGTAKMFGYLLHSTTDTNTKIARDGQVPSDQYTLNLQTQSLTAPSQYGTTTTPTTVNELAAANCSVSTISGESGADEFVLDADGTEVTFNDVYRASIDAVYNVCMAQKADPDIFHGTLSDEITITIADI